MPNRHLRRYLPALLSLTIWLGSVPWARADEAGPSASEQAEQLIWKHRYHQAADLLLEALKQAPKDVGLLESLAQVYVRWGQPRMALAYLERARQAEPGRATIWLQLAEVYQSLGDSDHAEAAFRKRIELEPEQTEGYQALARFLLWERRQPEAALAQIDAGLKRVKARQALLQLRGEVLMGMGRYEEALQAYQSAIDADPDGSGWSRNNMGRVLIRMGRYDQARKVYAGAEGGYRALMSYAGGLAEAYLAGRSQAVMREAIKLDPKAAEAYTQLARQLAEEQRLPEAESVLQQGLKRGAPAAELLRVLGEIYARQGKIDQARDAYRKAIAAAPDSAEAAYEELARMLAQAGKEQEALAAFIASHKDQPDAQAAAYVQMGNAYQYGSWDGEPPQGDNDALAAHYLELAVATRADDADVWQSLARVYLHLAEYDKALAAFRKSYGLKEDPQGEALALLEVARGRRSGMSGDERGLFMLVAMADSVPDPILEPFRDSKEMLRWFGRMAASDRRRAMTQAEFLRLQLADLTRVVKLVPDNQDALLLLADTQQALGRPDQALATWEQVAKLMNKPVPRAWALNRRANSQGAAVQSVMENLIGPLWAELGKYPDYLSGKVDAIPAALATTMAGHWPEVKQRMQQVIAGARADAVAAARLQPADADIQVTLARSDWFLEQWDQALLELREVMRLAPENGEAYAMAFGILRAKGDKNGAVKMLEEAVARTGEESARYRLARGYLQNDDREKAVQATLELVRRAPHFRRQLRKDPLFKELLTDARLKASLE